jgi:predicted TIM-barrel fold metal-dependent hydrolase
MPDASRSSYVIISSDAHAGSDIEGYRPYLAPGFREDFDSWSAHFQDAWADYDVEMMDTDDEHLKIGAASFLSPYNWDSGMRLTHMDSDGIAAEVIFPNTVPPFYPSGVISAPAPSTTEEYRRRWAGLQAHNRWLVDFCAQSPQRRAGIAQVFLNNVDDAVDEVHWARRAGLAGVLIPTDHIGQLVNLYEPRLDPFWAACSELAMPVHRHGIVVGYPEDPETGPAAPVIGVYESSFFSRRGLSHLVFGGVFQRHPDLKFVFTETRCQWVPAELAMIDAVVRKGLVRGDVLYPYCHRAAEGLDYSPYEYFERQCYVGASGMTSGEVAIRYDIGVDRIMWGTDYPHHEGTWPHTTLALRWLFADLPEHEVRKMTSENAAALYGFDLRGLQVIADAIGPTVREIATQVDPSEIPQPSMCETFGDGLARMTRTGAGTGPNRHWTSLSH